MSQASTSPASGMAGSKGKAGNKRTKREAFGSRNVFILSAIGSAVGLGNIWRFPSVAYESGGGAFLIPYLCALLTAGIPLLFFDYAIGHKYRGSAPLAMRRLNKRTEALGWWQVLICVIIGIYYAAIVAWAAVYTVYSARLAWGKGSEQEFFLEKYLQMEAPEAGLSTSFPMGVLIPMILVWVFIIIVMSAGIRKGIGRANNIFMPLLTVMFILLVIQSLMLPGAATGLNEFFTPNWEALKDTSVWITAYGHIFFSLSIAFGIMVTYSSYLKRKTDLTGSGLVVAFANSSFEILAGIGIFAALGFMAQAQGVSVSEAVTSGPILAFVAFPTIASNAFMGPVLGVLFFGSLTFAGVTSMVSILEVIVSAFQDKLGWGRVQTTLAVLLPLSIASTLLFASTTGLPLLDVVDKFVNSFGITFVAAVTLIAVAWFSRKLPVLAEHLNHRSSFKVGKFWMFLVGGLLPILLTYLLASEFVKLIRNSYAEANGYPEWFVYVFGWGMAGALVVAAILLSLIPWSAKSKDKFDPEFEEYTRRDAAEKDAGDEGAAGKDDAGKDAVDNGDQKGATA
ncbi:sodium-dependent transporter [Pseudoglutamicibacter albus]|uniref:sodium-dependent transporter n=1 Tax=Pseudoglutamicibacter albus TaxID=98671 RepID=UPI0009FBE1F3|nr:sodium-dependent transporter [Pseudoglutamicibacter albus]